MSDDELKALQETATQARTNADELNAALTDASTDEERALAADAIEAATTAETAFNDAKAKADADAAQAEADAKAKADADAAAQQAGNDASRTGYADKGLRAGDACTCPDGRTGTVHQYDAGLICIPNADQG
jgi:hypothetical protein